MAEYDAIIIGAGQGGNPLAHKLADLGQKVALIEEANLGGSCINYGCTPTKAMVASARAAFYARSSRSLGVQASNVKVDFARVVERRDLIVERMRQGLEEKATSRPTLEWVKGHARFTGAHSVDVDGKELTSQRIFINTGTKPSIPSVPGLADVPYLTNRTIMELKELPSHLIILGGSYIGLEFAQMFRRFGSRVTIIETAPQILPREDADVAEALAEMLADDGIYVQEGARVTAAGKTSRGAIDLHVSNREGGFELIMGSHLLVATGQTPNTDDLSLDKTGIETDERGYIRVDGKLETSVPGVWAMGDVKGGPAFTHVSYDDHLVIFDNIVNGKNRSTGHRIVPYALYTDPELGRVGMTEKDARAAGYKLKIGSIPAGYIARAIERGETRGLMKVVINAENDRILGASILTSEGAEVVQTLMALMMADQPYTLFEKAMFIHPTMTEGFFALMDSVQPV